MARMGLAWGPHMKICGQSEEQTRRQHEIPWGADGWTHQWRSMTKCLRRTGKRKQPGSREQGVRKAGGGEAGGQWGRKDTPGSKSVEVSDLTGFWN